MRLFDRLASATIGGSPQSTAGRGVFSRPDERRQGLLQQRRRLAEKSEWERFELDDLEFGKRWVTHRPSGRRYFVMRGELGPGCPATAYALAADGDVIAFEAT